jgi:hypothetical protein
VEGGGWRGWSGLLHGEFLKKQAVAHLQKRGERTPAAKVEPNSFKTAIEIAQKIKDKSPVVDELAKVTEGILHALELPTVCGDVNVALLEVAEGGVEVEGASFAIATEPRLVAQPGDAGGGATLDDGLIEDVGDAVHASPIGGVGGGHVGEDMAL